jgi:tRNA(fMet)-specific endonuclease VapC
MHLLDSDTLSHLQAGNLRATAQLRSVGDIVGTTIVTKIEVLRARFETVIKASDGDELLTAQNRLLQSERLFAQLLVVQFDRAAARLFDSMREVRKIKRIGRADLLIASIALAQNATLVTRNLRRFREVPNLKVVNWVDS